VKTFKNGSVITDKVLECKEIELPEIEEEIPMVYDPKKVYDFDYFTKKTKNQLINIVWELQKFAHKNKKVGE